MKSVAKGIVSAVITILISGVLGASSFAAAPAKSSKSELGALRDEVTQLRGEVEGMRRDLRALLERIGAPPEPQRATVTINGGGVMGKADAPLTIVEFSDYECPFCRRFEDQTLPKIKAQYIDTGKVRYVFRDFPLDQIHPQARKAAEAAHCAQDQGKYWEAHDLLFQKQQQLQTDELKAHAKTLGLDTNAFNECLDKEKYAKLVQDNLDDGIKAGVRGTPSFFLGKTSKDGKIDGLLISGARPFDDFRREIDRLLAEK